MGHLIVNRKRGEYIDIGGEIVVEVIEIRGARVKLGIFAPASVVVNRREVTERIAAGEQRETSDD